MQTNYTSGMSLRQKIVTGIVLVGIGLVGLLNNGCLPSTEKRLKTYSSTAETNLGKLELCGCMYISEYVYNWDIFNGGTYTPMYLKEKNPENQRFRDEMCKQGIVNSGETPGNNFREQGARIFQRIKAPMTNVLYDGRFVFFSKGNYPQRFAVKLDTLTVYEHIKDDDWKYNELMTDWARKGQDVYAAIDKMKAQESAMRAQENVIARKSQAERDADVVDGIKTRVGTNLATMGLLKAIADYAR